MDIKKNRKKLVERVHKNIPLHMVTHPLLVVWKSIKFVVNARYRSEKITRLLNRKDLHQNSLFTRPDRYPYLFKSAQKYFKTQNIRILSYGCSTGEEVFTLRKYFPGAEITGIDINKWAIKQARRKNHDPKIHFATPEFLKELKEGHFHLVFALGVLQSSLNRKENRTKSHPFYSFSKFEEKVRELNDLLKVKGLLIIDNTDYDFKETSISEKYKSLEKQKIVERERPVFGKDNLIKATSYALERIYIKTSD